MRQKNMIYHYILDHKPIPYCENCRAVVRPQIVLTGEMVSNDKVTPRDRTGIQSGCSADPWFYHAVLSDQEFYQIF